MPRDTAFSGDRRVSVIELPLRIAPVLDQPTISPSEPASVTRIRRKLQRAVSLRSRIWVHGDRLVWALPDAVVPGGGAEPLYLVIKAGASVVLLVNPKKKQYRAAPPARLAALLEGTLEPARRLKRVELLSRLPNPPAGQDLQALLVTREERLARSASITAWIHTEPAPKALAAAVPLAWRLLLLPVLPDPPKVPGSAKIERPARWPVRFAQTPTGQARALGSSLRLRWQMDLQQRTRKTVPARLLQFPPDGYRQVFGPVGLKPGRQLLQRPIRQLRPRWPGEPRTGIVHAQNRTLRTLFYYADGILLGWVAPRSEMRWPALPAGYYRFYGHSLLGTMIWGPQDAYVPGPVRVRTPRSHP